MSFINHPRSMTMTLRQYAFVIIFLLAAAGKLWSQPFPVNAAIKPNYEIEVRFVVTETTDGRRAHSLGTDEQKAYILGQIQRTFTQIGARVKFREDMDTWVDDFAFGALSGEARDENDFGEIFFRIPPEFYDPNSGVITVVFLDRLPGDSDFGEGFSGGQALLGANETIAVFPEEFYTRNGGLDAIAYVLAHEIGHNLGLEHFDEERNLMNTTSTRSTASAQISQAQYRLILQERFTVGNLASIGTPEIQFVDRFGEFFVEALRSTEGFGPLVSSVDIDGDFSQNVPAILQFGIIRSEPISIIDFRENFYRAVKGDLPPPFEFEFFDTDTTQTTVKLGSVRERKVCVCEAVHLDE